MGRAPTHKESMGAACPLTVPALAGCCLAGCWCFALAPAGGWHTALRGTPAVRRLKSPPRNGPCMRATLGVLLRCTLLQVRRHALKKSFIERVRFQPPKICAQSNWRAGGSVGWVRASCLLGALEAHIGSSDDEKKEGGHSKQQAELSDDGGKHASRQARIRA
jgi:hypothetical protein